MTTVTPSRAATAILLALEAVEVRSPSSFAWMGDVSELPEHIVRLTGPEGIRRALVGAIRARLYDSFYTQGAPRPAMATDAASPAGLRSVSHDLAAADASTGWLEPGWRLVGEEEGRRVVERGGLRLWVTDDEIEAGRDGPHTDGVVGIRMPAGLPAFAPGFYTARGDRGFAAEGPLLLDRLYLDLRPEGAVPFVREATRRLNRAGLAFEAKVVDDIDAFDRRDAAVVFVDRRDRARALVAVKGLAALLAPFLDEGGPAMTLPISPGLSFAENPGGGASFGLHRCLLLAEAAVTAAERGLGAAEDRLQVARERFTEAGTTVDAPYQGSPAGGATHPLGEVGRW